MHSRQVSRVGIIDSSGSAKPSSEPSEDGPTDPNRRVDYWPGYSQAIQRVVSRELRLAGNRSTDDQADVVQLTLLKLVDAQRRGYIGASSHHSGGYVVTVARNTARDWNRQMRRRRHVAIEALDDRMIDLENPGDFEEQRRIDMMENCLAGLPADARNIYRMRFECGMSQFQVAMTLKLSRQQVRTIETRFKKAIRHRLELSLTLAEGSSWT